ncbi:MAG: glycosyltransferase family 9 protein [Candidatus Hydrogenedentes bacterium]|nr:glycosyltransferase family 9 protein [Candidatus Hydrogenedentota bacterium]
MERGARILVFCLPGIGDALLFTPAFRALKEGRPDAHVTALVMFAGTRDILLDNPYVDEVILFDFIAEGALRSLRFVWGLRRRGFDVTILGYPSNRLEYNLIARLIGAKMRVGHRYRRLDWVCGNWLNTHTVQEDDALSNIDENLRLASIVTGAQHSDTDVELALDTHARAYAVRWLCERRLTGRTLVGFHPGGSTRKNHRNKRWAWERYAELGGMLARDCGASILVFGGADETTECKQIASGIGADAHVVNTMDLRQTCALINVCAHFVSNDSALMHLAGALGVPTTGIFGPTSAPWVRIPGAPRREVSLGLACQPCFRYSPRHLSCVYGDFRCLADLKAERVAEVVKRALAEEQKERIPAAEAVL